jgi:hypothetical protein
MATQIQYRRGTTAEHSSFAGAIGEITVDTDKEVTVVHDGSTNGGFPAARVDGETFTNTTLTSPVLNTSATGTAIKDEDGMVSDSDTHLATQQSIKAYADSVGGKSSLQPITASVAASALTLTLNVTTLDFRSATLGSGTVNTRAVSSPISVVISSGSTLGTISAVESRIAVIAIDNAGTVELAAVNLAGGNNLDETTLITTTAEGGAGAADSSNVIYSTAARTDVPFRVVGFVESTQATAGTWATAPSTIQGYGGQAFAAMSSLGYGQTWQDVFGSRTSGVTYYNDTGKPITICVSSTTTGNFNAVVGGVTLGSVVTGGGTITPFTFIVPPNSSYVVTNVTGTYSAWVELR